MAFEEELKNHLDSQGRLLRLPTKFKIKVMAILFLAEKFAVGKTYTQAEVDAVLLDYHLFNDCCTLRRELVNFKLLERTKDGRSYWVPPVRPSLTDLGL